MGITIVETPLNLALGIVAVAVNLHVVTDIEPGIAEELVVVFEFRRAPDHHVGVEDTVVIGVCNIRVAGIESMPVRQCAAGSGLVVSASLYSKLRLAKPLLLNGRPMLPETLKPSPSPS